MHIMEQWFEAIGRYYQKGIWIIKQFHYVTKQMYALCVLLYFNFYFLTWLD